MNEDKALPTDRIFGVARKTKAKTKAIKLPGKGQLSYVACENDEDLTEDCWCLLTGVYFHHL